MMPDMPELAKVAFNRLIDAVENKQPSGLLIQEQEIRALLDYVVSLERAIPWQGKDTSWAVAGPQLAEDTALNREKSQVCLAAKVMRALQHRAEHIYEINADVFITRVCVEVFGNEITIAARRQLNAS